MDVDIDVIDDDPLIRELYTVVILQENLTVRCHESADDYLNFVNSADYTPAKIAVMSDLRMPGKSGYELIDELQQSHPEQRYVVITGNPENRINPEVKACFYLAKPLSVRKLAKVLNQLVNCYHKKLQKMDEQVSCKVLNDLKSFAISDWTCPLCFDSSNKQCS